jgi:hypothetical protein
MNISALGRVIAEELALAIQSDLSSMTASCVIFTTAGSLADSSSLSVHNGTTIPNS